MRNMLSPGPGRCVCDDEEKPFCCVAANAGCGVVEKLLRWAMVPWREFWRAAMERRESCRRVTGVKEAMMAVGSTCIGGIAVVCRKGKVR